MMVWIIEGGLGRSIRMFSLGILAPERTRTLGQAGAGLVSATFEDMGHDRFALFLDLGICVSCRPSTLAGVSAFLA